MASKTEKQRILSLGLNLLPPADKISDGEALLLDNWRVDQQGQLRSTRGVTAEAAGVGSGKFHTLARVGNDRYGGIGTDLWYGTALGTKVAGGFDGNPLGLAFYQGAVWVMNRNKQLRVQTAGSQQWGIAAPSTAPTAAAGAANTILLNPYSGPQYATFAGFWVQGADSGSTAFNNYPSDDEVVSQAGTVTVVTGSASVVGIGTAFDQTMVGKTIEITTTVNGGPAFYGDRIDSVQGPTELTMAHVFQQDDPGSGLSYQILDQGQAVQFNVALSGGTQTGVVPMYVTAQVAAAWEFVTEYAPGLNSTALGNAPADADTFQFPFYAEDPTAIDTITITLYFDQNLSPPLPITVSLTLPGSILNQNHQSWTNLTIQRAINLDVSGFPQTAPQAETGFTTVDPTSSVYQALLAALGAPHFLEYLGDVGQSGFGPTFTTPNSPVFSQGSVTEDTPNWTNITGLVVTVRLNAPTNFGLGSANIQANVPGSLTGALSYFITFFNDAGEESSAGPEADVNANGQSVELTNIPISSDPQVTKRGIYRIGGGLDQSLLVGKVNDNTSSGPFFDVVPNSQAQDDLIIMPTNHDLPPPARGVLGPFLGQLIAFNTDKHPARYFWTPAGQPWFFPGADDDDIGNWEDAGNDDDAIIGATYRKRLVIFYKQRSIWRLAGSPDTADAERTNANIGIVGSQAIANAGQVDYIVGPEGVYSFNGDFETKVSAQLDPIFKGDWVQVSTGEYLPPIDLPNRSTCVLELINDRLYFSYPEPGQPFPNVTAILHIPSGQWSRRKVNGVAQGFTCFHYEGAGLSLMGGQTANNSGYLQRLEDQPNDNSGTIHLAWQSRFSDQGLPDNFKWYTDLEVDFQTAILQETPSTLTVYLVYDNGTKITLRTINSNTRTTVGVSLGSTQQGVINQGLRGKNAAIRIEGDANSTCIIYGTYLHWYPEERQSQSFDSGTMRTEQVRQIDYLEMETTGSAQQGLYILTSDLPGNLMAERATANFTLPSGRGANRFRLPSLVEGRQTRLTVASQSGGVGSSFQGHGMRMRQRVIGEYIDGTIGEFFESAEFSVAPGRVGELKDFLLDYDTANYGTGTPWSGAVLQVYSDLPGNTSTVVRSMPIPARQTRSPYVFAFEDVSDMLPYGQSFKVRIIPPPGGVIRLHGRATFRARIIGTFFDGSQGEIWETQPIDLASGTGLFREMAIVAQCGGPMTVSFLTELPQQDMQVRASLMFDTTLTTKGRDPIYLRFPGNTKGRLQKVRVSGAFAARIFEVKVYGRGIGNTESNWQWYQVPLEPTSNEFTQIQMPVRATAEEFTWVEIPVDPIE